MIESLPPDLQQFVSDELANGHYRRGTNCWSMPFVSIVTAERLRAELCEEINSRLRQLDQGEAIEIADNLALDAFSAQIGTEVQEEVTREQGRRA